MTIEQLEHGNEIMDTIKKLEAVKRAFSRCEEPKETPGLKYFMCSYLSDKITELEKQLEEL